MSKLSQSTGDEIKWNGVMTCEMTCRSETVRLKHPWEAIRNLNNKILISPLVIHLYTVSLFYLRINAALF